MGRKVKKKDSVATGLPAVDSSTRKQEIESQIRALRSELREINKVEQELFDSHAGDFDSWDTVDPDEIEGFLNGTTEQHG